VNGPGPAWKALLGCVSGAFTSPSLTLFLELATAWVLCPARRTVTGMMGLMDPATRAAHDAYHRLLRAGAWSPSACWVAIARVVVGAFGGDGCLVCYLDDTLFHKSGRKVDGAGSWRDAIRSTGTRVVYATGLNLVVLGVRVVPPWGGEPLALPMNVRLHRKGGATLPDLSAEMMGELAGWFPTRSFVLCTDGAYATLAGRGLERTHIVSRMRRDAALFEAAPPRTGRRGRPRTRGQRLATPDQLATRARKWVSADVDIRGKKVTRLLWAKDVLWYRVSPKATVRLVIVRDLTGVEHEDYFFTTDPDMAPADVVSIYAGRWSIEDTFRATKQSLGGEQPQSWKTKDPNEQPPSPSGSTTPPGPGTSRPPAPHPPGPNGPGTAPRPPHPSPTRSPTSAEPFGENEFPPLPGPGPSPQK
jgi:hypothetical protein